MFKMIKILSIFLGITLSTTTASAAPRDMTGARADNYANQIMNLVLPHWQPPVPGQGQVTVLVRIGSQGEVLFCDASQSSGNIQNDLAACTAVSKAKNLPAPLSGLPSEVRLSLPLNAGQAYAANSSTPSSVQELPHGPAAVTELPVRPGYENYPQSVYTDEMDKSRYTQPEPDSNKDIEPESEESIVFTKDTPEIEAYSKKPGQDVPVYQNTDPKPMAMQTTPIYQSTPVQSTPLAAQPQVQSQAQPAPSGNYASLVLSKIQAHLRVPRGYTGEAKVDVYLHIGANGQVQSMKIDKSSGNGEIDNAALEAVKKTGQLPAPQGGAKHIILTFTMRGMY